MKNNTTEIVCILDRSGSMAGYEKDTVGGFNATLAEQQAAEGRAYLSTILFNNSSEVIHDRVDIQEVKPMTLADYCVGGCTALLDAIGAQSATFRRCIAISAPRMCPRTRYL